MSINNSVKEQIDLLYSGTGITGGGSGSLIDNVDWKTIVVTSSASGSQNKYSLSIFPQNSGSILLFVNGVQTRSFTYASGDNSITFVDGNVPAGYAVTAFILEKA